MPAPLGDDPSLLPLSAKASSSTSTTDRPGTVTLLAASPSSVAVIVTIVAEMTCISTPIATPVRLGKKHQEQWSASSGHSYCAIADCYSGLLSLYHPSFPAWPFDRVSPLLPLPDPREDEYSMWIP